MSDVSITAANCVPTASTAMVHGTSGETIAAGKAVYKSSSTGKWMLADSNAATAEPRAATHIALCSASANQPITVGKGQITIGGTLTPGLPYYLSDTPGGICLVADVGSGEYVCLLGMALTAAILDVAPKYTGVSN